MSSPQSADGEQKPKEPTLDSNGNGDTTTNSSSGADSAAATPKASSPAKPSEPKPFVYDPKKITLKFIFANRDGVNVIVEFDPTDTIGEVKGALLSMWPEAMPACSGGDKIRLICMGKGMLSPDSKTLAGADVPVFKTHPTPVNVAVRPEAVEASGKKGSPKKSNAGSTGGGGNSSGGADAAGAPQPGSSGCSCIIL